MRNQIRRALEALDFYARRASADDMAGLVISAINSQLDGSTLAMLTDAELSAIVTGYTLSFLANQVYQVELPEGMTALQVAQLVAHDVVESQPILA